MAVKDTRRPISQLNFDTEDRLLPATHYRYAKNGRSGTSDRDGEGSVENIRGNVLRNPAFAARGQVVGSCSDVRNNAIIDFIAGKTYSLTYVGASVSSTTPLVIGIAGIAAPNTVEVGDVLTVTQGVTSFTGRVTNITIGLYTMTLLSGTPNLNAITAISVTTNNYIRRWYPATNTFENLTNPVLMSAVLGFSVSKRIYNAKVIESSFGQLLTWVEYPDGIPCLMNIDKMKIGGAYYNTAADNQYIRLAKQPPQLKPTVSMTNVSGKPNTIMNRFFQFRYRYVYDDGYKSVFSPISDLIGTTRNNQNAIAVTVNNGHATVAKIEIAYREGNGVSSTGEINTNWYVFTTINRTGSATQTVNFLSNEVLETVSQIDSDKLFESVPITASAIEVVDSNQIVLSDIREGYTSAPTNITTTVEYEEVGIYRFNSIVTSTYTFTAPSSPLPQSGDVLYWQIGQTVFCQVITSAPANATAFALLLSQLMDQNSGVVAVPSGANVTTNIPASTFSVVYWIRESAIFGNASGFDYYFDNPILEWTKRAFEQPVNTGGYTKVIFDNVFINGIEKINSTDFKYTDDCFNSLIEINVSLTLLGAGPGVATFNMVLLDVGSNTPIYYNQDSFTLASEGTGNINILVTSESIIGKTLAIAVERISSPTAFVIAGSDRSSFTSTIAKRNGYYKKGFKNGTSHKVGIVYYDQYMRQTTIQGITTIDLPAINQKSYKNYYNFSGNPANSGYVPQIKWEIRNVPPDWAYYYSWVYNGGGLKRYSQFISLIDNIITDVNTNTITISNLNLSIYKYSFKEFTAGDRVRLMFNKGGSGAFGSVICNGINQYIDGTIQGVSANSIVIEIGSNAFNSSNFDTVFVECYSFNNSEFFFEQDIYEIGNPTTADRFHKGPVQDQNPAFPTLIPAIGYLKGNTYFRLSGNYLDTDKTLASSYLIESQSISDNYVSDFWDKGRPQVFIQTAVQQKIGELFRWGNKLINNTQVNNLSQWDEGNFAQVNAKYGAITGLRQIGYTLKIIQWANYNTAFIGRREVQNADGSTQLVVTDNLIGTINPSEMEFGTKYPGSIINTGRRVYFFDSLKSKYIVDDGNGLNEIAMYPSETGAPTTTMTKYWRQIAETINGDSNYEIITGFDYLFRDMYVTILNRAANTQETLYYNEMQNAWKYFMDMEHLNAAGNVKYIPDFYGNVGQVFVANMMTNLFEFNQAESGGQPVYGQLFKINSNDPVKPLVVETIGMIEPDKVKVFLNHSVHANLRPALVEIRVPANEMYPNGMYTVLKPANYAYREGVFYADIKRDAYTKGFTTDPDQLRQNIAGGRPMRGHVCLVRLTFDYSDYTKLFTTAIGMIPSELS